MEDDGALKLPTLGTSELTVGQRRGPLSVAAAADLCKVCVNVGTSTPGKVPFKVGIPVKLM